MPVPRASALVVTVTVAVVAVACGGGDAAGPDGAVADDGGADAGAALDAPTPIVVDDRGIPDGAALYTLDRRRWDVHDAGLALDAVLVAGVDNVILYVHGRGCGDGGEPEKSLAGALPALAQDYTAAPLLLFWPGSDDACPLGFPEERARAAGPALAVAMAAVRNYQLAHPARVAGVRFTLLTHSMGSLVLEGAVAVAGVEQLPAVTFDTAVVNAGASAAAGHAAWLARVGMSAHRYVTVNDDDTVLTAAGVGRSVRLGRRVRDVSLAVGVDYLDVTANGVNHAYYLRSGQRGAGMIAAFAALLDGRAYDLAHAPGIGAHQARDGAVVHVFDGT